MNEFTHNWLTVRHKKMTVSQILTEARKFQEFVAERLYHSVAMLAAFTLLSSSWMVCFAFISESSADCSSRRADMSSLAKRRIFHGISYKNEGTLWWKKATPLAKLSKKR